jgi:citrate synthase
MTAAVMTAAASEPLLTTSISHVDGARGVLRVRGHRMEWLLRHHVIDVPSLLWHGDFSHTDRVHHDIAVALQDGPLLAQGAHSPMNRLRMALMMLAPDASPATTIAAMMRAVAGSVTWQGSIGATLLASLVEQANAADVDAMNACVAIHAEHALNPGTLAVRLAASTGAPRTSALIAGVCALEGPLHGGAANDVGAWLAGCSSPQHAVERAQQALQQRKGRVPGFGHPIYRVRDPRASALRTLTKRVASAKDMPWFDMAVAVDERMALAGVHPNVDFYAATLYATLGIHTSLYTPLFAVARCLGWNAHIDEQRARGRLLSPEAAYDGPLIEPAEDA